MARREGSGGAPPPYPSSFLLPPPSFLLPPPSSLLPPPSSPPPPLLPPPPPRPPNLILHQGETRWRPRPDSLRKYIFLVFIGIHIVFIGIHTVGRTHLLLLTSNFTSPGQDEVEAAAAGFFEDHADTFAEEVTETVRYGSLPSVARSCVSLPTVACLLDSLHVVTTVAGPYLPFLAGGPARGKAAELYLEEHGGLWRRSRLESRIRRLDDELLCQVCWP